MCIFFSAISSDTVGGMQFTEADLQEFIAIWKEEFHEPIAEADARLAASVLMELYVFMASREED